MPSIEELMAMLEDVKAQTAELKKMRKELKDTEDKISFLKAWIRIIKRKPEYVV